MTELAFSAQSMTEAAQGALVRATPAAAQSSRSPAHCRFCRAPLRHTFVDLGMSPLANANVEASQLTQMERFYPLRVYVCAECFLVQLEEFETPEHIFTEYAYLSSYSESWLRHAKNYVEMIVPRLGLGRDSQVIEIASNDGYLLQYFVEKGIPVLGVEPAANAAALAIGKGIPTRIRFFGAKAAAELRAEGARPALIVCNNVLAHVPDLNDFVEGLRILLGEGGAVTGEFPHLLRLLDEHQFDTIYHEHFSYFSLWAIRNVFARHGLSIFDVEELPTHGGSLRIFAGHAADRGKPIGSKIEALLHREQSRGLTSLAPYLAFTSKVEETKRELLKFLIGAKERGQSVVGYGAPAKGNTLLNFCGIRSDLVDYVVDVNPRKQGRYLPGTHIPIHSPERIRDTRPDYLLLLPWNLKDEIAHQMAYVREWGCQFVTPIPKVTIYS